MCHLSFTPSLGAPDATTRQRRGGVPPPWLGPSRQVAPHARLDRTRRAYSEGRSATDGSKEIHRYGCGGETVGASERRETLPLTRARVTERLSWLSLRADSPRWAGAIAGTAACLVAGARIVVAGGRNVASFIIVGADHVRARVPVGVPVTSGQGYDGQFYYRMALGPLNFNRTAYGIRMDTLSRFERISYPALSWLVAAGHTPFVPWSLVVVNVLALACLGALGAVLARDARAPLVLGPATAGLLRVRVGAVSRFGRDRDCHLRGGRGSGVASRPVRPGRGRLQRGCLEPRDGASRGRPAGSGTSCAIPAPTAPGQAGQICTRRSNLPRTGGATPTITWLLPGAVFVGWQIVVKLATGSWPLLTSGQHNLDFPLAGLIQGFRHYLNLLPSRAALLWFGGIAHPHRRRHLGGTGPTNNHRASVRAGGVALVRDRRPVAGPGDLAG